MYQNPTLFPQVSNRESWVQIFEIADDDTGEPITLTDAEGNPLYGISLEIDRAGPHGNTGGYGVNPWYDWGNQTRILATLANYITILDVGVFQVVIPKSVMQCLRRGTYNVFVTIDPNNEDDGRQLLIGRLPVLFGGHDT